MPEILLAGAYGQANPGDEALLAALISAIGTERVVVTSQTPVATEAAVGAAAMAPTAANVADWLRRGRHLVVGGGTIFKALHPTSGRHPLSLLVRTHRLVRAAAARGITISLLGVGADELPSPRAQRLARAIVRHTDLLVLRDDESARILAAAGAPTPLRIGADLAWRLFDTPTGDLSLWNRTHRAGRTPRVLVALSHLAGDHDLTDRLAPALRALTADTLIDLQPWQHDQRGLDHDMATRLAERIGRRARIIDPPSDLYQAAVQAAQHDLVVGLRFHALVAAAAAGTPFVAVAHEPKLAGLANRFGQRSVPPHASTAVLARAIGTGARQPPPPSDVARAEMDRAAEALRLLRLVHSGGATIDDERPRARLTLSAGGGRW